MSRLRVGIIDILALPSQRWADRPYHLLLTKQFASITPQAISVWCRRLGHQTFYATYYGEGDPYRQLPDDLNLPCCRSTTTTSTSVCSAATRPCCRAPTAGLS